MNKWHMGIRIACLLTLLAVTLLSIGVAYGRYSTNRRETLAFEAAQLDASRTIEFRSAAGWQVSESNAAITFSLDTPGRVSDLRAHLRLTATEGLDPSKVVVTLTVGETTYRGEVRRVETGVPLYDKMGFGTEYRFYDAGEELVWTVSDATVYTLTVDGAADVSLLRLTATAM